MSGPHQVALCQMIVSVRMDYRLKHQEVRSKHTYTWHAKDNIFIFIWMRFDWKVLSSISQKKKNDGNTRPDTRHKEWHLRISSADKVAVQTLDRWQGIKGLLLTIFQQMSAFHAVEKAHFISITAGFPRPIFHILALAVSQILCQSSP